MKTFTLAEQRMFFRQLQVLFSASVMLVDALEILQLGEPDQDKADVLTRIGHHLMNGHTLSVSLQKEKVFPRRVVSLIRLGEEGGHLGKTLQIIADELETQQSIVEKIRSALYYPLTLGACSVAGVAGLLFFFLPKMVEFASSLNTELPAFVNTLFRVTSVLADPWVSFAILQLFLGLLAALYLASKTTAFHRFFDALLLDTPVFGQMSLNLNCFQFASGLHALLLCGCPLVTALKLLRPTLSNSIIRAHLLKVSSLIEIEGTPLAEALDGENIFPSALVGLIACGEQSGALDKILTVVADFYQERLDEQLEQVTALIEPAILLFLGITVGTITLLFFLPMVKVVAAL